MSLFQSLSKVFKPAPPVRPKLSLKRKPKPAVDQVQTQAILQTAQAQAREIVVEAKDEALKIRQQAEHDARERLAQLTSQQQKLAQLEARLDGERQNLEENHRHQDDLQQKISHELTQIETTKRQLWQKLETIASLSQKDAQQQILSKIEKSLAKQIALTIKEAEDKAKAEADERAKEILVDAMKHGATDYVTEYTVSSVKLPDEDVKGRIIGKEGRNIRAFEQATGVDLDLDETPGEVRLSSFDSLRREIARLALTRLIADGRIQPSRIEEFVRKAQADVDKTIFEEGKKLCHQVKVYNLPPDIIKNLGKFKFRFSYGQNMIAHTLEETKIGLALAQEIKADIDTVRLGCLLHDIGKVITDEEGSHVDIGVKLLSKYHLPQAVIDCVEQHHEDKPFTSREAVIVYIADAISGSRPGARYEDYDEYVKRLSRLEEIATSFAGVKEAYAIQAGREIRVIVNPLEINDEASHKLAHDIKQKIQEEVTYPGTVKVIVVREIRASEVAK